MSYFESFKGEKFPYLAKVNDDWNLILQDNVPKRVPSSICSSVFVDLAPSIVLPRSTVNVDENLWLNNLTRDETELFLSGQEIGSFLIREAESKIDGNHKYSLSVKSKSTNATNDIKHYPILQKHKRNDFIFLEIWEN